ncbi:TatD family hydrolase [Pseudomonas asuensis]|uniref:TatD-related deoxyribonuclease n=1 Tax=Pseudomonas asuensis TaxID=1825787 RepID=A0ABQ2GIL7_9PSED|nr:TatD family hydrolase [Pseudomonas asuensis]GGL96447.1 TatD-related deoxyribonuclease [Pseudomonas asuensis]
MLIDTHNHLDFPSFDDDREALLQHCQSLGVQRQVLIGVEESLWSRLWSTALAHEPLYAALALHPCYLDVHREDDIEKLRAWLDQWAGHPKLCALGEFGLDYYIDQPDKPRQQALFESHLELAIEYELPSLLHVRKAHADVIATLKRYKPPKGGIVHAFAGSYEEAREYLKLGFKLGLGGAPTWPQANRLRKVVPRLPLDGIVLETDAPDIAPAMYPGIRNSPVHLPDICAALAELLNITSQELAQASTANACDLFGWDIQAL